MTECLSGNFQEQINPTPVIGESDSGFGERISTSSCRLRFEDFDIDPGCDQNRHNATASATVLLQEGNLIFLLPCCCAIARVGTLIRNPATVLLCYCVTGRLEGGGTEPVAREISTVPQMEPLSKLEKERSLAYRPTIPGLAPQSFLVGLSGL